jgi:gliding motility-associated-like protein
VDDTPTPSNAGPNQTICISSNSTTMAGNTPTVGTGTWTLVSGTGTITTPNSPSTTVTGLGLGVNTFQWTISNGVCPPSASTMTITVDDAPTPSSAGPDQSLCIDTPSTIFAGNNPVVGTGTWTVFSGSGNITNPNQNNSPVTNIGVGQNYFVWTITNGVCPSSSDTVYIRVYSLPTPSNAGTDQIICENNPATILSGNNPSSGNGVWTFFSGGGNITSPTQNNSTVTNLSTGINQLVWTISSGPCPASSDTMTVQVDQMPTPSLAGADQTICSSAVQLAANSPTVGNGLWTVVMGSGSVASPTNPGSSAFNLWTGIHEFAWTISNGVCPSSTDTVRINVDSIPTPASAGTDQAICINAPNTTLNGSLPTIGTGNWSLFSGSGTIASPPSPNSQVNNLGVGNNLFIWTTTNGVCPSSHDTVLIRVDPLPTPSMAGPDQTICHFGGNNSINLAGNNPAVGNGTWSFSSGIGTISNPSNPSSSVTGLFVGTNTLVWTITSGVCPASYDTVSIFVDAMPPPAYAGPFQAICENNPVVTLNADPPIVGTGVWATLSGSGQVVTTNSPNSNAINLSTGLNIFSWTVTNGVCPPSTATVTIDVNQMPTPADAGPDRVIYIPFAEMGANFPIAGNGNWQLLSGSGNLASPSHPLSQVSGLSLGSNVFRWTISSGVCPASSDDVTLTVHDFFIPNGISPNGDGINDELIIQGMEYWNNVSVKIFNRWGSLVFQDDNYRNTWNGVNMQGEPLIDDTYFYIIEIPSFGKFQGMVVIKRK